MVAAQKRQDSRLNGQQTYVMLKKSLGRCGIEAVAFEAKQLMGFVLQKNPNQIPLELSEITPQQQIRLQQLCDKRCQGYPLQYILGEWEFFGYPFVVGEGVLIPRQDTEVLCETALSLLREHPSPRVLDLCSGSGCIAIVLDREISTSQVVALEKSVLAQAYLQKNIARNQSGVIALLDDATAPETDQTGFDMILCNPPYLNELDVQKLQQEVSHEPIKALYAPGNGYYFYDVLTPIWKKRLNASGWMLFEVGVGQASTVANILMQHQLAEINIVDDLCGIPRVVYGRISQH